MTKNSTKLTLKKFIESDNIDLILKDITFEKGMDILNQIVEHLEEDKVTLEDTVKYYEKGSLLLKHLKGILEDAENKIKVIEL